MSDQGIVGLMNSNQTSIIYTKGEKNAQQITVGLAEYVYDE